MTDSKTAKKIQVLKYDARWFLRLADGDNYRGADGWTVYFKSEAEAQAKARELREWEEKEAYAEESKNQKYDPRVAAEIAAAAQPTETRPPQTALQNMLNAIHCLRLEVDGSIVDDIHNKFMAALSETLDVYRAARAAAPVETPKQEDPNIQPATYDGMRPPESEVILKFISQSRHLPDCPDECHGKCAQRIAQSFFDDGLAMKHDWEKLLDEVLEVHNAAATELVEPAPRPQRCEVIRANDSENKQCTLNQGHTGRHDWFSGIHAAASSPVARPQPAMCIHGLVRGVHCNEPAARPQKDQDDYELAKQQKEERLVFHVEVRCTCEVSKRKCPVHEGIAFPEVSAQVGQNHTLESFNNHGLFEFRGVNCPYCHQSIALWGERFKGSATNIVRVRHVHNGSANCNAISDGGRAARVEQPTPQPMSATRFYWHVYKESTLPDGRITRKEAIEFAEACAALRTARQNEQLQNAVAHSAALMTDKEILSAKVAQLERERAEARERAVNDCIAVIDEESDACANRYPGFVMAMDIRPQLRALLAGASGAAGKGGADGGSI